MNQPQIKEFYNRKCEVYNTPLRVAISGKIAAGKTTLAKTLIEIYNLEQISFASSLKEYCSAICYFNNTKKISPLIEISKEICNINKINLPKFFEKTLEYAKIYKGFSYSFDPKDPGSEQKTDSSRKMLQYIGEDTRFLFNPSIWINCSLSKLSFDGRYIVDDLRTPLEYDALKEAGFFLIRLVVTESNQKERIIKRHGSYDETIFTHPTETFLDFSDFDFYINANPIAKNVLMKGIAVLNILDYSAAKLNNILKSGNTNDYRRNLIMEFENRSLEDGDSTNYYSSRYRSDSCEDYFT